ncbi:dUTP diphosphatase [Owenweeksia hongkongensis]|uniref:dUTP diphosphatase n=1 Tax=Owenweeksia hongkongensis TaxID=253245 RepID=UPI003A9523D8
MADNVKVKIINKSGLPLPEYKTVESAGMDLSYCGDEDITLQPLERKLAKTGIFIELPMGYEAQVRPRSGMALKHGIGVLNSPGTIDSDYRGEIGVIVVNLSNEAYTIKKGERIAQMVIAAHARANFIQVEELTESDRGAGGFGSTGK